MRDLAGLGLIVSVFTERLEHAQVLDDAPIVQCWIEFVPVALVFRIRLPQVSHLVAGKCRGHVDKAGDLLLRPVGVIVEEPAAGDGDAADIDTARRGDGIIDALIEGAQGRELLIRGHAVLCRILDGHADAQAIAARIGLGGLGKSVIVGDPGLIVPHLRGEGVPDVFHFGLFGLSTRFHCAAQLACKAVANAGKSSTTKSYLSGSTG